jgi:ferritin-like metal-binding protein YciE
MDASPDVLAERVRAKRTAIDNDLELLRVRVAQADPRRRFDRQQIREHASQIATVAAPAVAGALGLWIWSRRRRRVDSLHRLLVHGLRELYATEQALLPALDRMRRQASSEDLRGALARHRTATETHIERLERVFRSVDARPRPGSSAAVDAIVQDAKRLLARKVERDVRDAWLIATAQRIAHLQIAGFGTVRAYADTLGFVRAAELLQQILVEERATDEELTRLAERFVNPQTIRSSAAL